MQRAIKHNLWIDDTDIEVELILEDDVIQSVSYDINDGKELLAYLMRMDEIEHEKLSEWLSDLIQKLPTAEVKALLDPILIRSVDLGDVL